MWSLEKVHKVLFGSSWNIFLTFTVVILMCCKMSDSQSLPPQVMLTIEFKFREEQNTGTYVGNVGVTSRLATTLSDTEFSRLKFELSDSKYFKIDEKSGSLTSSQKIDREEVRDCQLVCKIKAEIIVYTRLNSGGYDLLTVINVEVEILDINDNAPKFPEDAVSLTIPESNNPNGELQTRGAIDKDSGVNSVQQYSFKDPTDSFTLTVRNNPDGSSYLRIVVKDRLDRETRDFYQLTVIATDGGVPQKSGSAVINITVTDINDNSPEFDQLSYNQSVPENVALKVPILKVHATDRDLDINAEISYQLSPRASSKIRQKFIIDERTGEISAQSNLDYEEDKLFQFIVEALDHGIPQNTARTNVNLYVMDRNDNWPQININLPPMGTEISESEPVGKFVAQVLALDADSGSNGVVSCSMDDEHFSMEKFNDNTSNMYKIVLSKPLDYEQASSLRVTVTCTDSGTPPLSNSTTFVVNVLDVNDNRPAFTESTYYATVMENQDGGEMVLQVLARDLDSGSYGKVSYSLEDKYDGLFGINPSTGTITVLRSLDREYIPKYDFHVIGRDNGPERLSSSSLVVITVGDENDEPPRFLNPIYFGNVLENQPSGTFVGNASATDPDSPANSKMSYSILQQGPDYSNFTIDAVTGAIKSTTTFDREQKDQYHFMIRVVDPTNPQFFSTCNFTVRVLDDNDHPPVARLSADDNTTLIIQYSTAVGNVITNVYAYDMDDPTSHNSELSFFIKDGDQYQLFNLNRFTGSLSLARMITARDIKTYHLTISVEDGGDPPKFDTKQLSIKINGTIPVVSDSGLSQNIVVVIILVGVTAILALAILITILIIRKIDHQRRKNRANQKNAEDKMYQLKQQEIFTNLSVNMTDDTTSNNLSKKGRKEVSFSLDEELDGHNTSNSSTQPLTSFKGGMERTDMFSQNKLSGSNNTKTNNGLMNIPVHGDKVGSNMKRSPRDEKNQMTDILKKSSEDVISQSSEDTDPSDSGRGGSEDDSSHRGSGVDPEHNSKLASQVYHRGSHTITDPRTRPQLYHQQRLTLHPPKTTSRQMPQPSSKMTPLRQSVPSQRSPHSSITSDFESDYSGDPASLKGSDIERSVPVGQINQSFGNSGTSGRGANQALPFRPHENNPPRGLPQDWPNRMGQSYSNNNNNNNNSSALMRSFHGQPSNRFAVAPPMTSLSTERLSHPTSDRPYAPPTSSERPYKTTDRSYPVSLRTNNQSSVSDDDRTTTSGSFLINPEDLRREIDSMIVRDSVV